MVNILYFALALFSVVVASFLGLQLQYTNAASIEVPKYAVDEPNPEAALSLAAPNSLNTQTDKPR